MQNPLFLVRMLFLSICIFLAIIFAYSSESTLGSIFISACIGLAFGAAIIGIDQALRRFNLKAFNILTLGVFAGYLLGEACLQMLSTAFETYFVTISPYSLAVIRSGVFLIACYFGMAVVARSSEELYISIPFIRFKGSSQRKKDLLIDGSALCDSRLLDLATTGLVDQQLIVPRYLSKELQEQAESSDEQSRLKARRSLDTLKKLESIPMLEMRYTDTDCTDIKDPATKILKIGRLIDANVLTTDIPRSQLPVTDGPKIININSLSQALKPLSQTGEMLMIKIQRYGKEPRQGVGYLDDGTMVVVNGGAEFIGETIRTQVLSVKHTSSGRMIFCNAMEGEMANEPMISSSSCSDVESSAANYFAH